MASVSVETAIALGALQGVLEWLPISSEGQVTVVLTLVFGLSASDAVGLSLFLHAGTALAAAVYYRDTVHEMCRLVPEWRPGSAFTARQADLSFLVAGTLVSACVGPLVYLLLESVVSALTGGGFVACIGVLLVVTGLLRRYVAGSELARRDEPDVRDAVFVGVLQGFAVLPGVSRSGVTSGTLLLRGHDATSAFRLSFLLSIPAAFGAGALAVVDAGGLPSVTPTPAVAALATSALVGLSSMTALLRLVERVPLWFVCIGLGGMAVLGGIAVAL